jgi:hypothetical protein
MYKPLHGGAPSVVCSPSLPHDSAAPMHPHTHPPTPTHPFCLRAQPRHLVQRRAAAASPSVARRQRPPHATLMRREMVKATAEKVPMIPMTDLICRGHGGRGRGGGSWGRVPPPAGIRQAPGTRQAQANAGGQLASCSRSLPRRQRHVHAAPVPQAAVSARDAAGPRRRRRHPPRRSSTAPPLL